MVSINTKLGRRLTTLAACFVVLHSTAADAQHEGHGDHSRAHVPVRLGTVAFPNSGARDAQAPFLRGLALLHSFHFDEAARAFRSAEQADTSFALPFWFEAFTHSHLLWGEDDPAAARQVLARLGSTSQARLARARTGRERAYGAGIEAFFDDAAIPKRARAFADSMISLAAHYPDDLEAAAFGSLASMMAIDQHAYPPGELESRKAKMVDLAELVFAASPNHPGAAHYLIHASDIDPSFTNRGLPAARAYARIAPDASHALHMPSHVFLRLGLWDEVAASNERAWAASRREMANDHLSGAELNAHSLSFLAYSYLEGGRWHAARALIDSARRVIGNADVTTASHVDARYAISDLAFLYSAETGRWPEAVLPPTTSSPPRNQRERGFATVARYERSVIGAQRGDTVVLASAAAAFRARADSSQSNQSPPDFIASELEGMLAQARGDRTRAKERFAHAGSLEDQRPIVGPPSFLFARELLGEEYVRAGQPDSASAQFERVLAIVPNRSASLLGLARARLAAGDRDGATAAYTKLAANWRRADGDLPALAEVRAGAAGRFASRASTPSKPVADDVRIAVLPLPEWMRAGATVVGRGSPGKPITLREGSNGMVCWRVVPGEAPWDARCYERSMAQLFFRVRAMLASGVPNDSVDLRIAAEARAGTLTVPAQPVAGYRMLGPEDAYVPATGMMTSKMEVWQSLHLPFATAAAMGLPDMSQVPEPDRARMPYVMNSGTWWAHVMIKHPAPRKP